MPTPITRWVERIKWLKRGKDMAKVYEVPMRVLRVVNAKYLTPNHETISVIDEQGNHNIYEKNQTLREFNLIVEHVKRIEPFDPEKPNGNIPVPPEPTPEPVPEPPAPEPVPPAPEPVPEPVVPVELPPEPPAMEQPAPEVVPDPQPGSPEAALQQAQEVLQQPPAEPAPEAPRT